MQKTKKKGRPSLPSRHQTTVHLTAGLVRRLRALQKRQDLKSMSAAVRFVLEGAL